MSKYRHINSWLHTICLTIRAFILYQNNISDEMPFSPKLIFYSMSKNGTSPMSV